MMATQIDEILETVRTTHVITRDVEQTVALQDLFNVSAEQAAEVMGALDRKGRRRLLWIITAVAGYDTFEFWLNHGLLTPWVDRQLMEMSVHMHDLYESRLRKVDDREFELTSRKRDLNVREAELNVREAELNRREGAVEKRAQRRAGEQVRVMRRQVEHLRAELERERLLNRRAKKLVCWVERGL